MLKLINEDLNKSIELDELDGVATFMEEELFAVMENEPNWWGSRSDPVSDVCSSFYIEGDEGSLSDSRRQLVNDIRTSFFESIDL